MVLEIPSDKNNEFWDQLSGTASEAMDLFWYLSLNKKILWAECFYISVDNQDIADESVGWAGQLKKILQVRWQKCDLQNTGFFWPYMP